MIISCEKCSTTYVLDDALIPPQGAPVQCTKCQHVFTAKPPAAEAPTPAPAARPGSSTMMFGAPPPAVAAAGKNQTMMFGAAPPAVAAAAPPAPNPKATMVFGAPAVAPAAPKAPTFGTPAANAAAGPVPGAGASSKNQTMMFGASPVAPPAASPAPAAAKNTTMMFGTPASNAAAAPASAKNTTMMFGAAPVAPAPAPTGPAPAKNTTMMFGAAPVAPAPAPAAPAKNQTMMFGTPASNAVAPPPPQQPQPAVTPSSSKATMVFGAVPPPPAPAPARTNQTMVFGTAASNAAATAAQAAAPAEKPAAKTQLMGSPVEEPAEETVLDQPGLSSRTVLFGTAQPAAKNTTMMFGRAPVIPKVTAGTVELAGIAADENQPNESTVRVDQQSLMAEGEEGAEAPAPEQSEAEARRERTQRFAMSDVGPTPPEGNSSVQARHNRTQLFAMTTGAEETEAAVPALSPFAAEPLSAGAAMVGDTTLPPTSPDRLDLEGAGVLQQGDLAPLDARRMQPLPLELPPEPSGSPRDLLAAQQGLAPDASETIQVVRGGGGGAGKIIVVVLALVALALAGVLAWRLFGRQLLGKQGSAEALKLTEDALAGLRRDDGEAQEEAMARLRPLLTAHPELHEPQAAMVLAAALQLDDAKALAQPDEARAKALKLEAGGTDEAAETARAKLETLGPALARHQAAIAERREALLGHVARLRALPVLEPGSPTEIAVLRAEAIARGVLGEHEALALAERVRQLTSTPDNWAELAGPEFALNGGSSRDEALAELEVVRARPTNSTFFRPYVLTARLRMQAGDDTLAAQDLSTVISLNGKHVVAQRLLASLTSRN